MSETLREVRLYGRLGARFGRVHRLAVCSTAEAIRALCVLMPGFERELSESELHGVRYACFLGKRNIGEDDIGHPVGSDSIRIAPVLAGAKRGGLFQTILGAVLIVAGAAVNVFAPGAGTPFMQLGAAMALGGVIQMLSPQQRGLSARDSPEHGASYNFNGAVNTSAQGNPAPLLYGRMIVGSAVISAGIYAEDQV
ncbi:tail assembly protein [Achromobacter sp. PD1]|jgi:predicted phage tail protein|uniref:tail assembly protein n=1 Tax=Achromobacter TaxID=222 RepID=UPI0027BAC333|nr:tail assembly protein [Achromobacter aegrifaciens]WLW63689.1 tail assembly protein [Achromobacter aegrifaciens]